jgi:DNA polymerase-3 subunit epsilon/ATP-dependent DNA helicase DinG
VVALLDRRVVSKRYGSTFLNSLPPCTVQYGPATDLPTATAAWLEAEAIPPEPDTA